MGGRRHSSLRPYTRRDSGTTKRREEGGACSWLCSSIAPEGRRGVATEGVVAVVAAEDGRSGACCVIAVSDARRRCLRLDGRAVVVVDGSTR